MNDRLAIIAIRDVLRLYLPDPRSQYGEPSREFIHTDEPLISAKYPRIGIQKRDNSDTAILSMGMTDFLEEKIMILDIQFWTSKEFKWDVGSSTYIKNDELVKEYLDKIWHIIKLYHTTLRDSYGISGIKNIYEGKPYLEPDTNLYTGMISIRFKYYNR